MSAHNSTLSPSKQIMTSIACLFLGCILFVGATVEAVPVAAAAATTSTTTTQTSQTSQAVQPAVAVVQPQVVQQSTNRVATPLDGMAGLVGGVMNMATMPMTTITHTMQSMGLPSIATAPLSAMSSLFQQAGNVYGRR